MSTQLALITQSSLSDIADAIRAKTGGSAAMTPAQMPSEIASIPSGGGTPGVYARYYIDNNHALMLGVSPTMMNEAPQPADLVDLDFSEIHLIYGSALKSAFQDCSGIKSITFPNLASLTGGGGAFRSAFTGSNNLKSISFAALQTAINRTFQNAFQSCYKLTSVNFPLLKRAEDYAFTYALSSCSSLTQVEFPELEYIGTYGFDHAFYSSNAISSFSFPKLKTLGDKALNYTFNGVRGFASISFPSLETIDAGAFGTACFTGCNALTAIHFPAAVQSQIEATTGYSTLWGRGAGNATVYFDL